MPPECTPQVATLEKLLDQNHAVELSEPHPIGGDAKISGSTAHCCRTALLVKICNKHQNSYFRRFWQASLEMSQLP